MSAIPAPITLPSIRSVPARRLRVVDSTQSGRPVSLPATGLAPSSRAQARRRQLLALLAMCSLLTLGALGVVRVVSPPAATPVVTTVPVADRTAVVRPGQTVWDVATANAPAGTETGTYAAEIIQRNGLEGGRVTAWQVLRLP